MKRPATFLLLILSINLFSQTESLVIQWDTLQSRPSFPHALYENGENSLPCVTRKIPWESKGYLPRVSVAVTESIPVSPDKREKWGLDRKARDSASEPLPDLNRPVEYSLVREAGKSFVVVTLLPFVRSSGGDMELVKSFRIEMEKEMALAPLKSESTGQWAESSVLTSGNWYRISVEESGIHKLTYEQLQEIGLANPANVRIYGSGASLLPEKFSEGYTDDLQSLPLYMSKGSDGLFSPGDYVLFYAKGPVSWYFDQNLGMYIHKIHTYSRKGYYFVTDSKGAAHPVEDAGLSTDTPEYSTNSYDYRDYWEERTYNLISSGKEWYGDNFNVNLEEHYSFGLPGKVTGEQVRIRVKAAARSNVSSDFLISAQGSGIGDLVLGGTDLSNYTATYAQESSQVYTYLPAAGDFTLVVTVAYNRPNANSEGWLNSITLNGRSSLVMNNSQLPFRDSRSAGPGNTSEFTLENMDAGIRVWDVTDPVKPLRIPWTPDGTSGSFRITTNGLREFIAFNPGAAFPVPGYEANGKGLVPNQDLHGMEAPEMVILAPEVFLEQAERLAEYRRSNDGLTVEVVLQQDVFNEFSSGTPDVGAIRNFMKMFYDRANGNGNSCRYLLLFGDGSYDNLVQSANNPNLILTYQSDESLAPTRSYVSDDFYGLLDTDESLYDGLLDIGIGRLPVSTVDEARILVDKIIEYGNPAEQGEWRNQLCFIGDDEDSNIHMRQAEELATYVKERYPAYNINKIYLDAYPQVELATGPRYPDVTSAINGQVNRGALIVNYTGHGGPSGLAHEKITTTNDITSWSNGGKLPLFITATCEFSRYDEYDHKQDQEVTSAGEEVLLNSDGGGIGLFTTTRLVYSGPNHVLNERFYEVVFEKDANQQSYRLGDIILYSKNNAGPGINKRNFTLLGDPSMRLVYPRYNVVTDSINGKDIRLVHDTLSAFQWVTVSGHMEDQEGTFMEDFDGLVYPLVFDKERKVKTLSNDQNSPSWSFNTRNNILYSGKTTVSDGRFSFGFFVPKDINYAFGDGKISYYGNNQVIDAHGSFEGFSVGGIGSENAQDGQPPSMDLFMNDTFFIPGGITDDHPALLVRVKDNFGINTTGNGIGHDLIATLDGDRVNSVILNEFYQANTNSYNSGMISYPFAGLETGRHEVEVKIWDIHNNSSTSSLEFVVVNSGRMVLESLFNYPNPFSDLTFFNIEHNRPDRELKLVLTICNMSGDVVRIIEKQIFSPGYRLEPVSWDGTSAGGNSLGGGVYLYRATLSTGEGEVASKSGKMIILK